MTRLRWEKQSGGAWFAYSGDLRVAMVVQIIGECSRKGLWTYSLDAVNTRWITKGGGDVKTAVQGKKSIARAWAAWLDRAVLQPKPNA